MQIPHQAISVKAIPCIREQCFVLLITWSPAWQGAGQVQISPRNQTEPRLWRQWSTNQLPTGKLPLDIQSACLLSRIFCHFYYKEKKNRALSFSRPEWWWNTYGTYPTLPIILSDWSILSFALRTLPFSSGTSVVWGQFVPYTYDSLAVK